MSNASADHEVSIIRFPDNGDKWHLVSSYLKLRKDVFIDQMAWPLIEVESMEFEQYDTFHAVYAIAHRGDEVLGGARLLRTDSRSGTGVVAYSYMIRDAYLDHLPGLPANLCVSEPAVDPAIWELTRFASTDNRRVGAAILDTCNEFLRNQGASECYFLGPPAFMRMARSMGYSPRPLGDIVGNQDGRFLAFSCGVV